MSAIGGCPMARTQPSGANSPARPIRVGGMARAGPPWVWSDDGSTGTVAFDAEGGAVLSSITALLPRNSTAVSMTLLHAGPPQLARGRSTTLQTKHPGGNKCHFALGICDMANDRTILHGPESEESLFLMIVV